MKQKPKTVFERFMFAFIFEILGIAITAPLAALLTSHNVLDMSVVTVAIATMALLWNMLYNFGFDHFLAAMQWPKTFRVRILHAFGFEIGLIFLAIPFVMWWLNIGLYKALALDIGLILFYLPYTYIYTLVYDYLRRRYWGRLDVSNSRV